MPVKRVEPDILYLTFILETPKQMIATFNEAFEILKSSENKLCVLTDYTSVPVSLEYLEHAMAEGNEVKEYISKSAIMGLTGLKEIYYEQYEEASNHVMKIFDTYEEAIAYLRS